jgi:hypothetical protein
LLLIKKIKRNALRFIYGENAIDLFIKKLISANIARKAFEKRRETHPRNDSKKRI